jgi:hypothetical protein
MCKWISLIEFFELKGVDWKRYAGSEEELHYMLINKQLDGVLVSMGCVLDYEFEEPPCA